MRRLILFSLLGTLAITGLPATARAWNKPGHMVVAAIAYHDLKRTSNQAVIDKVIAQLTKHPDFDSRFKPRLDLVDPQDQELYLFMLAARWADDIRGHSPDDDPRAHYIDRPFVPPGMPDVATVPPDPSDNLIRKFNEQVGIIKASSSGDADRARALTWIFHLAGDVHQPLHCATMFTHVLKPPQGDRGGNEVFIRARDGAHTINLHFFWDGLILGSERLQAVRNRSVGLASRTEMDRSTFPQLANPNVEQWVSESFALATSVAYRDGEIQGSGDRNNGEVLPDDYIAPAQSTAERQAVLAGYRLADLLKVLAASLP